MHPVGTYILHKDWIIFNKISISEGLFSYRNIVEVFVFKLLTYKLVNEKAV
jgi:hypothetical protein